MSEHPTSLADLIGGQDGAAHSIFSPSGSAMWLRCLGSLIPNVLSTDEAGEEAAEGTVAHDIADEWHKSGVRPDHLVGTKRLQDGYLIEITSAMLAYVQDYLNWCETTGFAGLTDYSEERVDTSLIMPIPNQGGTADRFACGPGVCVLTDLKYGKGVPVYCAEEPEDQRAVVVEEDGSYWINGNTQVLMYMIGVFLRYDHLYRFERIIVRICQPRLGYFGVWETNRRELLRFMQFVMDRAPGCLEPDAPRTPGPKQCQFCRVKATCTARLAHLSDLIDNRFTDLTATRDYSMAEMAEVKEIVSDALTVDVLPNLPSPAVLSVEALEKILPYRKAVENWFEAIHKQLVHEAMANEVELRVWKVVEARTNRKFKNETKAVEELMDLGLTPEDLYTTSLISPAQAEEALHERLGLSKAEAKAALEGLAEKPPGSRSLALRTDSRPALPAAGDRFTPVSQSDEL